MDFLNLKYIYIYIVHDIISSSSFSFCKILLLPLKREWYNRQQNDAEQRGWKIYFDWR